MSLLARVFARTPLVARCALRTSALRRFALPMPSAASSFHSWSQCYAPAAPAAAKPIKYTTNIAGLDVVPNGREVLMGLLKETIASIEAYNKQHGFEPAYNLRVRKLSEHRLQICEEEEDEVQIEKRIWYGQIEELIEHAEDEMDLLVVMNEEVKPWVENPAFLAEMAANQGPNFGETVEQMLRTTPIPLTDAEKAAEAAYWKPIDEEIAQDQKREAEERAARKK